MAHLINLFSAVALLVWGTSLVRTGVLALGGANMRAILAKSLTNRLAAAAAGIGVTALVQSSTATALILGSFTGQGLVSLPAALAVMLGADIGTSLVAVVLSFKLTWLSPLALLVGVVLITWKPESTAGRLGRTLIGLGLMLLALRLISESAAILANSAPLQALLASLTGDVMLEISVGALLAVVAYSSLAVVLLTATLAGSGVVPMEVALALILGANLGSGVLAVLVTAKAAPEVRQVPLGNLIFKLSGVLALTPLLPLWADLLQKLAQGPQTVVVLFHLFVNISIAVVFLGFTGAVARLSQQLLPRPEESIAARRPRHLDPAALDTPSLAMSCATREALHQADVVETMLRGVPQVLRHGDLQLSKSLRAFDDQVDHLYAEIKHYLTRIPLQELEYEERRRWSEIMGFTINMEQIADIVERILDAVEDKKIRKDRCLSPAGMAEIVELHSRLSDNLRLGTSVFLNGSVDDAYRLLEEKTRFRELERRYAATHLERLARNTIPSIETSSLHLDLIRDLRRINSHVCSIAYPVVEGAAPKPAARAASPLPAGGR